MSATVLPFKRPSEQTVKAKKAEIAARYRHAAVEAKKYKHASPTQIAAIRLSELNRIFYDRHGGELPNDETGRKAVMLATHHLASLEGDPLPRLVNWASLRAPWLTVPSLKRILGKARFKPKAWKADELAAEINLDMDERQRLHITTIGAVDCNKRQRKSRRKAMDRERKRRARAAKKASKMPPASAP